MSNYRDELDAARLRIETLAAQLEERDAALRAREAEITERDRKIARLEQRTGGEAAESPGSVPKDAHVWRGPLVIIALLAIAGWATAELTPNRSTKPSTTAITAAPSQPPAKSIERVVYVETDPPGAKIYTQELCLSTPCGVKLTDSPAAVNAIHKLIVAKDGYALTQIYVTSADTKFNVDLEPLLPAHQESASIPVPVNSASASLRANIYDAMTKGEVVKARSLAKQYTELAPGSPEAWYLLGASGGGLSAYRRCAELAGPKSARGAECSSLAGD